MKPSVVLTLLETMRAYCSFTFRFKIPLCERSRFSRLFFSNVYCVPSARTRGWRRYSRGSIRFTDKRRKQPKQSKKVGREGKRYREMFRAQKRRDWRRRNSVVKLFVMVDRGTRTKPSAILSRALAATRKVDGRCTAATVMVYSSLTIQPRTT